MARLATLNSQNNNGATQESAQEQSELVESSRVGEYKKQHLMFDPEDLAQLKDLEVNNQVEDLNL